MGQLINLWKSSFNGGELSPRLSARSDQVKYGSGGSMMQGFIPTVQGPIIRRGGTQFIAPVQNSAVRSWLVPFRFNTINSYMIEAGDQIMRFYTSRGIVSDVSANVITVTSANPGIFSCTNTFNPSGDMVQASGFAGALGAILNGQIFTITGNNGGAFSLLDIFGNAVSTASMPAYTSGGTFSRFYQIATPYHAADLTDATGRCLLSFYQSEDVIYIAHPLYPLQILSRLANSNWTIAPATIVNGPFQTLNTNQAQNVYATPTTTSVSAAASNGGPTLIRLTVGSTTGITTGDVIEVINVTGTVEANGSWPVTVIDGTHVDLIGSHFTNAYVSGGTVTGRDGTAITLTSNAAIFTGVGADELFMIQNPINTSLAQWQPGISVSAGARQQSGFNTYVALNSATSGNVTPTHTQGAVTDGATGVNWLYEDSGYGVVKLNTISSPTVAVGTVQVAPPNTTTSSSNPSWLWAHGISGSVQGYPNIVTIFDDRLTLFQGIQAFGSVSDDYLNFAPKIGGQQTADSGWVITMPVSSPAQWATPHNDLLVGTLDQEIIITQINTTAAFGPQNIRTVLQTAHGSVRCDAQPLEFFNMYPNKSGQQLRQQVYSWMVNGYISNDMTLFGEHLPKGPDGKQGIVQQAWCQDPDYLDWCNTTDGRLICFSFHSEQQVTAWHNHPIGGQDLQAPLAAKGFTNAVVESVRPIPSPDGTCDDLWMIVKRTINGKEMRYIEYLTQYFTDVPANIANAFYVDSGLTYIGVPTQKVYGYNHLIGQTLDILLNGGPLNQITVAADGSITLPYKPPGASMTLQAGFPCWARFISMRPEGGSQLGTAQTLLKQISQIAVRLLNSLGFSFGDPSNPKGESGFEVVNFMTATQQGDQPILPYTGDKGVPGTDPMNMNSSTGPDGLIEILVNQPVPYTLCGMRATMEVSD